MVEVRLALTSILQIKELNHWKTSEGNNTYRKGLSKSVVCIEGFEVTALIGIKSVYCKIMEIKFGLDRKFEL